MRRFLALLLVSALAGCSDAGEDAPADTGPDWSDPSEIEYAPQLDVDIAAMVRHESGLLYRDVTEGEGEAAAPGDTVVAHYTGWLPDGQEFDSSHNYGDPFTFVLGAGNVIRGWDVGLEGMQAGGTRRLVLPPALAYGSTGAGGVIPPGASLVFDVELVEVRRP